MRQVLSRAYIAGPELSDAMSVLERVAGSGHRGTLGYFNPAGQPAREIADICLRMLAALSERGRDCYAALKAPPMHFDIALIDEIACLSNATGVGIHFDSHAIDTTDATFAAIDTALRVASRVGCTLPARWPRSLADAERAIALGLRVRVVKGQWPDPQRPDFDPRAGYLDVIDRLAGRTHAVAVATHDPPLAHEALRRLLERATPCELELLFGLPMRAAVAVARGLGVPVRIYIPFGAAWLPYAIRQLARRPRMLLWLLKDALAASAPQLLRDGG